MSSIRKWTKKDGTVCIKHYETIKGKPALEYKREQGRRYYAQIPKEPKIRNTSKRSGRATIAESLPNATLHLIKHYREAGLSILKLSQNFGLSRYTVKKALKMLE
jgi:AraC-like DNA-binding protein